MKVEVEQGRYSGIDLEDDVSAAAAVTAVRTAERHELLAVHAGAAVSAISRRDVQDDAINEAGHCR
jgi:hypothetical protein